MLLAGAAATGLAGTLWVVALQRGSRLKQDASLGIVLSTFFAVGILFLRYLQNNNEAQYQQSGLDQFIYGKAAFLRQDQVVILFWCALAVLGLLVLFYKEFKLLTFDAEYANTLGFRGRLLEVLLSLLIVVAVMISLRAVGVVLTVGLLVAPAAAARQWTHRLSAMILLAMVFGVFSGLAGAVWSDAVARAPTGPAVVLVASALMLASLLFAPQRGVVASWIRILRHRLTVRRENLLTDFYRLGERSGSWRKHWTVAELAAVRGQPAKPLRWPLRALRFRGLVDKENGHWRLTEEGLVEAARIVRNHRLWELYLAKRLDVAADHVHRDAEAMEHALPPEVVAELEATLENPERDPHGNVIPREPVRSGGR